MRKENQTDQLASVALIVTPTSPQTWDPWQLGHFLQAVFYETVSLSSPVFADHLHSLNALKPFTVSLPLRWRWPAAHPTPARTTPAFCIRFTALTEEVCRALTAGLLRRSHVSSQLSLGSQTVDIQEVLFTQEASALARVTSYEELYSGPQARTVRMRFVTPTSFRTGRGNLPFPLPASVYRSLWQKWQRFAPLALQLGERVVTAVEQYLFPARYLLRTETVNLKGVPQVGCVGTCQFELLEGVSAEDRRAITALSRFAAYAGVGMKTTMGMGQTLVKTET
ncbi:MAG: CRISPR system precrRNA processing endoribonuclease RAMP protein Cas6 [Candidatus Binatia bacterium]